MPSFMGFMKRFEPGHLALIQAVKAGEVGDVDLVMLTNRDPKVTLLETQPRDLQDRALHAAARIDRA